MEGELLYSSRGPAKQMDICILHVLAIPFFCVWLPGIRMK